MLEPGDRATNVWNLFVRGSEIQVRYKLLYRAADNRDYETDWRTADDRQVLVPDPFPSVRTVTVIPPSNWTVLDQVFVDLSYEDKANDFSQESSLHFAEDDHVNKTFSV